MRVYFVEEHYDNGLEDAYDNVHYDEVVVVAETERKARSFIRNYKPNSYHREWLKGDPRRQIKKIERGKVERAFHENEDPEYIWSILWYTIREVEVI